MVIIFLVCIRFRKSGTGGVTHLSPSSDDLNLENLKDVINWILIGSDGLQVIPGSAPKSKCKWRKEFVAVERIELSCYAASGLKPDVSTNFTTRHPYIFYYQKLRPYAEPISAYDSWLFAQRAYSEPLLRLLVLLISAFLRFIRLSLSPTFPSDLHYYLPALFSTCRGQLVTAAGFGTYLVSSGCTYGLNTVSFHSIGFEVSFATVSAQDFTRALRPWLHPSCL